MKANPKKYLEYRKQIENELNQRFKFIIKGTDEANAARKVSYEDMERHLQSNPRLVDKVRFRVSSFSERLGSLTTI